MDRFYKRETHALVGYGRSYKAEIWDRKYSEKIAECTDSIRADEIVDALNKSIK